MKTVTIWMSDLVKVPQFLVETEVARKLREGGIEFLPGAMTPQNVKPPYEVLQDDARKQLVVRQWEEGEKP